MSGWTFFVSNNKTIILVSHDVNTIKSFSTKGLFINNGTIMHQGDPLDCVIKYMKMLFPEEMDALNQPLVKDQDKEYIEKAPMTEHVYSVYPKDNEKYWGIGGGAITKVDVFGLSEPNIFFGGEQITVDIYAKWKQSFISKKIAEDLCPPNIIVGMILQNKMNVSINWYQYV